MIPTIAQYLMFQRTVDSYQETTLHTMLNEVNDALRFASSSTASASMQVKNAVYLETYRYMYALNVVLAYHHMWPPAEQKRAFYYELHEMHQYYTGTKDKNKLQSLMDKYDWYMKVYGEKEESV